MFDESASDSATNALSHRKCEEDPNVNVVDPRRLNLETETYPLLTETQLTRPSQFAFRVLLATVIGFATSAKALPTIRSYAVGYPLAIT